jgi:hypothetical protein
MSAFTHSAHTRPHDLEFCVLGITTVTVAEQLTLTIIVKRHRVKYERCQAMQCFAHSHRANPFPNDIAHLIATLHIP